MSCRVVSEYVVMCRLRLTVLCSVAFRWVWLVFDSVELCSVMLCCAVLRCIFPGDSLLSGLFTY